MKRIYIAGPYTKGDVAVNVRNAVQVGFEIIQAGHAPYIPHLCHFMHYLEPHHYEIWMAQDFAWVKVCDALVRLPGESSGADREVALAREYGIPVLFGVDKALAWLQAGPPGSP